MDFVYNTMTTTKLPRFTRALVIKQASPQRKPLYHDAVLEEKALPTLKKGEILVRIGAAAFNHRDVAHTQIPMARKLRRVFSGLDQERSLP